MTAVTGYYELDDSWINGYFCVEGLGGGGGGGGGGEGGGGGGGGGGGCVEECMCGRFCVYVLIVP